MAPTGLLGFVCLGACLGAAGGRGDIDMCLHMGRKSNLCHLRPFVCKPAPFDVLRSRGVVVAVVPCHNGGNYRCGVGLSACECHPVTTTIVRDDRHDATHRGRRCGCMDVAAPGGLGGVASRLTRTDSGRSSVACVSVAKVVMGVCCCQGTSDTQDTGGDGVDRMICTRRRRDTGGFGAGAPDLHDLTAMVDSLLEQAGTEAEQPLPWWPPMLPSSVAVSTSPRQPYRDDREVVDHPDTSSGPHERLPHASGHPMGPQCPSTKDRRPSYAPPVTWLPPAG